MKKKGGNAKAPAVTPAAPEKVPARPAKKRVARKKAGKRKARKAKSK
jgi:hypothetical protein